MNLVGEAQRLRLDVFAVGVSRVLADAGVPHVLLKGPSTSNWLYDPPRSYCDIDMLVPRTRVDDAAEALAHAGVADRAGGRLGEEAPHSLLMAAPSGLSLDLHVTLPSLLPERDDRIWRGLSDHVVPLVLDVGTLPALDVTGRCVVLALHALANVRPGSQALTDLQKARAATGDADWAAAARLASALGHEQEFRAGLAQVDHSLLVGPTGRLARLYTADAPPAALGLARLAAAPWSRRPLMAWRELVPSRSFMRTAFTSPDASGRELASAYVRRLTALGRALPAAVSAYRASR